MTFKVSLLKERAEYIITEFNQLIGDTVRINESDDKDFIELELDNPGPSDLLRLFHAGFECGFDCMRKIN